MNNTIRSRSINKVCVIGLGYVGLPTAVLMANAEYSVLGVDVNAERIAALEQGKFHVSEPGLMDLLEKARLNKTLRFSSKVESSDAYVIAVPTPVTEDKKADLSYIFQVCTQIAPVLSPGQLIVLESTSPPETTMKVSELISNLRPDLEVSGFGPESIKFAYCPERVLPGNAIHEITSNQRLVGGITADATSLASELYEGFVKGEVVKCTAQEAELSKLVENSYRDVNIAFANEVARLATKYEVSAERVISLANLHPRVNILSPGVGVGGHCISVDPWFLLENDAGQTSVIRSARLLNDEQPANLVQQIVSYLENQAVDNIYCLGLSYKSDSDDLRESPAIKMVQMLLETDLAKKLTVVEPHVSRERIMEILGENIRVQDLPIEHSVNDLFIELVSHSVFKDLPYKTKLRMVLPGSGQASI